MAAHAAVLGLAPLLAPADAAPALLSPSNVSIPYTLCPACGACGAAGCDGSACSGAGPGAATSAGRRGAGAAAPLE